MSSFSTTATPVKFIELLHISLGRRKIRYFCLAGNCQADEPTPLFLGADILSQGTNTHAKNWYRIHQRYGKEGLATNVEWSDAQVLHIRNSSNLWFYNIQGLFKLSFEYQGRDFQRDCLLFLKEEWLKRIDQPHLTENMSLTWEETLTDHRAVLPFSISSDISNNKFLAEGKQHIAKEQKEKQTDLQVFGTGQHTSVKPDFELPKLRDCESSMEPQHGGGSVLPSENSAKRLCRSEQGSSENIQACKEHSIGGVADANDSEVENASGHARNLNPGDTSYFLKCNDRNNPTNVKKLCLSVIEGIQHYVQKLLEGYKDVYRELFKCLLLVIKLVLCDLDSILTQTDTFPYSVIESYIDACKYDTNREEFQNDFGISPERNIALTLFSQWLGVENASLQDNINRKAESFKLAHINCIDNLPPPEEIISEVFPPHMKILLAEWMTREKGGKIPRQVKDVRGLFPFILLILEFANGTFISGVSHVIHAKLVHVT